MMKNEDDKPGALIELSTVYFYTGSLPNTLSLKDCGLALPRKMPELICGLYGRQSKQEGFMAAHAYALRNKLEFTVIDFTVRLDFAINPGKMKPEDLPHHDFLSLNQVRRQTWESIAFALEEGGTSRASASMEEDGKKLLLTRPDLIAQLCDLPEYQHFRVVAFDAKPAISEQALQVGAVPVRHWAAIESAVCRLNPTTQVALEYPGERARPAVVEANAPVSRPRVASRPRG
jgi:hypothetical protein